MWLAFDTETTGLPTKRLTPSQNNWKNWDSCRMVQLAWEVRDDENNTVSRQSYIIKPDNYTIPQRVTNIHGISTDRALTEGYDICEVIDKIINDIVTYGVTVIVAHNISFDNGVIKSEMYRYKLEDALLKWQSPQKKCTMEMGSVPGERWPKLSDLYKTACGPLPDNITLHDATWDAKLCADIYHKLRVPH
jgi:DNA polymerase III epsilon subunit-like protein